MCGVTYSVEISYPGRFFWLAGLSYSRANAVKPEKNVTFEHNGASSVCTTSASAYTRGHLTDAAQRRSPAAVDTRELKMSFATCRFRLQSTAVTRRLSECVGVMCDVRGRVVSVSLILLSSTERCEFFFVVIRFSVSPRLPTTSFSAFVSL